MNSLKILSTALFFSICSTNLFANSKKCQTEDTRLHLYCIGEKLTVRHTGKQYRPGIKFNVKVCENRYGNLIMEVYPFGLFTDHADSDDYKRPTVRTARFYSQNGRDNVDAK